MVVHLSGNLSGAACIHPFGSSNLNRYYKSDNSIRHTGLLYKTISYDGRSCESKIGARFYTKGITFASSSLFLMRKTASRLISRNGRAGFATRRTLPMRNVIVSRILQSNAYIVPSNMAVAFLGSLSLWCCVTIAMLPPTIAHAQNAPEVATNKVKDPVAKGLKSHRLIRRPLVQNDRRVPSRQVTTPGLQDASSNLSRQAAKNETGVSPTQSEGPTAKSDRRFSGSSVMSTASPTTSSSSSGAAVKPTNTTAPSPSVSLAAANAGNSSKVGSRSPAGRSAQRLVAELPNLPQLITPTPPGSTLTPPATPPAIPAIGTSPSSFSFIGTQGGANPVAQALTISNTGGGSLSWSASDNSPWLTLAPATGSGNGAITLAVAIGGMAAGSYTAMVTLNATGATPVMIPVSLTVTATPVPPAIGVSPTSLSFSAQQGGGNPAAQTLNISNTGGGTLSWSASDNASWLTTAPGSGTGNGAITLTAATGGMSAGTHSGVITVSAAGASPKTVPITITVSAPPAQPTISMTPTSLAFTGTAGGTNPATKTVTVTNSGTGTLAWSVTDNANWLTAMQSGNSIVASVNLAGLTSGNYNGFITVSASGAANAPQTIPVSLVVGAAPTPSPTIAVSPGSFTLSAPAGSTALLNQTLTISNPGGGTLNWTVTDDSSWVSKNLSSGTGTGAVAITVNPSGLTAGTHTSLITVAASGATNTPQTIPMTLTVTAPPAQPTISTNPTSLAFTGTAGGSNPASKNITIANTGTGTLTWTVTDNANWLAATQSGNSIVASVNMAGLASGTYTGAITVTATGATNTPQTVPVNLTVSSQSTNRSATLMWAANTEPDLTGYKVYMATASGGYGAPVAVLQGNVTSYVAPSLQVGTTYFFVITSYDNSDNESAWSNEVSKSIF